MVRFSQRYAGECSMSIAVDPATLVSMALKLTNEGVKIGLKELPIVAILPDGRFGVTIGFPFFPISNLDVSLVRFLLSKVTILS
jgi:hypothetical protein